MREYCAAGTPGALRRETDFLSRIKLIWAVQPLLQKYFCFSEIIACRLTQITSKFPAIPSHSQGALRNVINAGRGAVAADAPIDERH
jgi:hypothetical protein